MGVFGVRLRSFSFSFVPIVGSLVRYLLVLLAFGSLLTYVYEGWTHMRDVRLVVKKICLYLNRSLCL